MSFSKEIALSANTQLIHQLFYFLDEQDYSQLVSLFKADGLWKRQGRLLQGHIQIMAALSERPTTQQIRHVISNAFLASYDGKSATLIAYMTAYKYDDGQKKNVPATISRPFLLSVIEAKLELLDDVWLFSELDLIPQFQFAGDLPA
jgi:hypothetical protein